MILEVQIQSFGACLCTHVSARASKFLFLKISRGLKYQYFFVKIGLKLSFTIKKKRKNTILKFELKNYFIFTLEKAHFWFLQKKGSNSPSRTLKRFKFGISHIKKVQIRHLAHLKGSNSPSCTLKRFEFAISHITKV